MLSKYRVWIASAVIFFSFFLLLGCAYIFFLWQGWQAALILMVPLGGFVSYALAAYLLGPLAATNYLLDHLVKDTLHELNAPLATIKANTQLLLREHKEDSSQKRLSRIDKSCKNLYDLYNQMEYYIKREIRLVKEENFDVKESLEACIERSSALQGDITLTCRAEETLVYTDKIGLEQCIMNILSNAYKYNIPFGKVDISLENDYLHICDTGIGMDEHTRFRVFDRYYQGNPIKSGYGIGLHKVREFCDRYGIFIGFVSKPGEGTKVSLRLSTILTKKKKDAL